MCNINNRYRGCKPNPDIVQHVPASFHDFVMGFCDNQEHKRVVTCSVCGGDSLCEKATIAESEVVGVFVCADCGHEKKLCVGMAALRENYDELKV